MSSEGISSRGSLRFDEFPTSMKPRKSRRICAQHAYWLLEKRKTVRVSTPASEEDRHARTPPSAFPFLHITMSKSRWKSSRSHTPEPTMEANLPLRVNDSRGVSREELGQAPLLSDGSRGRVQSRRKWDGPARSGYLGTAPPIVKRLGNDLWTVLFPLVRGPKATILPEYAVTLSSLTAW
jgi:hypothetical protein